MKSEAESERKPWMIGVGASAGGLEALTAFVRSLPENAPASFIVAQHLSPHARSMMTELLGRQTRVPVETAHDGMELTTGRILIIPPNYDGRVEGNVIRLAVVGPETRPKPSVDTLFCSIAEVARERAVGIILSGTGTDGAEGMRRIKEHGGKVFTQTSLSAKYDGMPRASFGTGLVDVELPPDELGRTLFSLLAQPDVVREPGVRQLLASRTGGTSFALPPDESELLFEESGDSLLDRNVTTLLLRLRSLSGHDFTQYKSSTVRRRLSRRMSMLGIHAIDDYMERLSSDGSEASVLAQELLVSVTSFFRDASSFSALEEAIEQALARKPAEEEFRGWIAGCATGEEAYSIALMLICVADRRGLPLKARLFATDLDTAAVAHARRGIYSKQDVEGVPEDLVRRHFVPLSEGYEVSKRVRDLIVFANQDLVQNPPFVKLDLVSCRNVLIYFSPPLQTRVLEMFHYVLRPGGLLFLGNSEGVNTENFEALDKKNRLYQRRNTSSRLSLQPSAVGGEAPSLSRYGGQAQRRAASKPSTLQDAAWSQLLRGAGLSAAVVDADARIQHIVGDIGAYVRFPQGAPDFRLSNVVSEDIMSELSLLLRKAVREAGPHTSRVHSAKEPGGSSFRFSVESLDSPFGEGHFLVSFSRVEQGDGGERARRAHRAVAAEGVGTNHGAEHQERLPDDEAAGDARADAERIAEVQHELASTREHLQTLTQELEIANEELQSLNEEMQATNEELQASNEELETTNEELQSSNEELTTLNEELNVRSSELRFANASLENIQSSIGSPLVVVDLELRVVRFNHAVHAVFHLSRSDVGRSLLEASCECELVGLEEKVRQVIRSGVTEEAICSSARGTYQMRIHPCRDESRRITGAVLVFFDNTDLIATKRKLEASEARMRALLDGAAVPICVKDTIGRYLLANPAFLAFHRLGLQATLNRTDRELFGSATANTLRDNDLEVLLKNEPTERQERLVRENGEVCYLLSSRFPLVAPGEPSAYAVGTVSIDVTAQVVAQEALETSRRRFQAIVEDQAVFVCRFDPDGELTHANGAFREFFGWGVDPLRPRSFYSVLESDDFESVRNDLTSLTPSEPTVQHEVRIAGGPGIHAAPRWVRWIHRALFNPEGQRVEIQSVGFDVTTSHDRTNELLSKETLFSYALEHTTDFLTVYRCEGEEFVLESFNRSAAKGRSPGGAGNANRLEGLNLRELTAPVQLSLVLDRFRAAVRSGTAVTFEEQEAAPGGPRHLSTSVVPLRGPDGTIDRVAALSRDITRLKRAEEALRDEKRKADVANRAKSDFLAAMSHELRTPLNVITGMAQVLGRARLSPELQRMVETIQRSSKVLLGLIEDVLDLSKIEAGKVTLETEPFSFDAISAEVELAFVEQARQKGLSLVRRCEIPEGRLYSGDAARVRQLIVNFVGNALKFTESGGIRIRVAEQADVGGGVQNVLVEVHDTGIGIPKSDTGKIFKRFSQIDAGISRRYGGTGLGLSICKELVELMQGTIGFDSVEGEGSVFWFALPLRRVESSTSGLGESVAQWAGESTPAAGIAKTRVLAVDDNLDSLALMRIVAREKGWELSTSESGRAALALLADEVFDVILMDMQMPELDGLETTRLLRKAHHASAKTPVIAFTANAMRSDRERCLASGMNDYVTKPIDIALLVRKVDEWARFGNGNALAKPSDEREEDERRDSNDA